MGLKGGLVADATSFFSFKFAHLLCFSCSSVNLELILLDIYECSIAMGCIYTEAKNYPREPAAHVAISEIFSYLLQFFN